MCRLYCLYIVQAQLILMVYSIALRRLHTCDSDKSTVTQYYTTISRLLGTPTCAIHETPHEQAVAQNLMWFTVICIGHENTAVTNSLAYVLIIAYSDFCGFVTSIHQLQSFCYALVINRLCLNNWLQATEKGADCTILEFLEYRVRIKCDHEQVPKKHRKFITLDILLQLSKLWWF